VLGDDIKAAREARGWTQQELATRLRVGLKTINNWESNRVIPKNRLGMLRDVLGISGAAEQGEPNPLSSLSDLTLLNELTRRAINREEERR
jgi:transcriptional regulator with XRE-family HTH domain